jgi:hypothetical protein
MSIELSQPAIIETPRSAPTRRRAVTDSDCALPIVIGVTGHRALDASAIGTLESVVAGIFAKLRSRYPSSPLVVLSPLAEGADRLVARVGLTEGARLIVPLPFDSMHYKADFVAEDSHREFDELLARADRHFVLPLIEGHDAEATAAPGHARDMHYAQVGAYIARTSQILIALWDGDTRVHRGGTSDVVGFRLHGAPPELVPGGAMLDAPFSGPLYHVVTPSPSTPAPAHEPYSVRTLFPSGYASEAAAAAAFAAKLESIDRFNRDELALRSRLAEARERSRSYITPRTIEAALDDDARAIVRHFTVADTLALHFAWRSLVTLLAILGGVFVAVLFFEVYGHLLPHAHWLLAGYLAAMVVGWAVQRVGRSGRYHAKYLDYRALAEGLRVQLFWHVSGLRDNVADHYIRKQRSVLDWIRDAIRTRSIGIEADAAGGAAVPSELDGDSSDARLGIVIDHWVADQASYYQRSSHRLHHRLHLVERVADALFTVAILLAIALLVAHTALGESFEPGHAPILAIGVCLLIAGVMHGFIGRRAYPELSKQFERMAGVFEFAHRRLLELRAEGDHSRAAALLKELGIEALAENGDWLVLHRERPVELPKGH